MEINFSGRKFVFFPRDEADRSVIGEIFRFREYRSAERAIAGAQDPILDVGAHAGFFACYARALNRKARIFALEPEPGNFAALRGHLKENKIAGVKPVQAALAPETGKAFLILSADSHNHRLAEFPNENTIEVRAFSLADFCRKNKIKKISVLKMDVEGGEYAIFEGLSPADLNMANFVILEYHYSRRYSEIETKLRENGFGVQVFPSKFDKTMGFLFARNKRFKK